MKYLLNKAPILLLCLVAAPFLIKAQTPADSLSLDQIISTLMEYNPALKQSDERIATSMLQEQLARTAYMPYVYATASAMRLFPIPSFDITFPDPEGGDPISRQLQMYPDISQDYGVKFSQLIYDFGKTRNNAALHQTMTGISTLSRDQLKQQLVLAVAGYYYNLLFVQNALEIRASEIATLQKHLSVIEKKQETGSATRYEILSTQVRISVTETQLTDLITSREIIVAHLNNLMGVSGTSFAVKNPPSVNEATPESDTLYSFAMANRFDMELARKNETAAARNLKIAQTRSNPSLLLLGGAGFKNGYISDINSLKFNYNIGLSLNIPLFESNRRKIGMQIAGSAVNVSKFEREGVQNRVNKEVIENYASLTLTRKKIIQFTAQLDLAKEAYDHAEINYEAGVITNLDLMDASNALAESRLMLLRAEIEYRFNLLKLKSAVGIHLYPE